MARQTCEQCGDKLQYDYQWRFVDLRVGDYCRKWALCETCTESLRDAIAKWRGETDG